VDELQLLCDQKQVKQMEEDRERLENSCKIEASESTVRRNVLELFVLVEAKAAILDMAQRTQM
jgi:hypothetical protein